MIHIESQEQMALIRWARLHPKIKDYLISNRNEGKMSPQAGKRANEMGRIAGVSDLFLALPLHGFHGLWIEMKPPIGIRSRVTKSQSDWLERMISIGYAGYICYGWDQAKDTIEFYLSGPSNEPAN